ncbi:YajG family lipoprotein [Photobacterium lutimaris]|uniref:Lipoprotein n=1 Tax=Photobacterium lutimaris TaxID=388278 RepID=A0A2T3ITU3_9GAMM|nr:YajG family lipoprotein [Photobacterium lutimaris]PSU31786.1 hypothetical protein C9I99_21620 [Photobacterium lutimaris]TDR72561.1 putative lipoprotein YajG [Photobacterium lutimaris]
MKLRTLALLVCAPLTLLGCESTMKVENETTATVFSGYKYVDAPLVLTVKDNRSHNHVGLIDDILKSSIDRVYSTSVVADDLEAAFSAQLQNQGIRLVHNQRVNPTYLVEVEKYFVNVTPFESAKAEIILKVTLSSDNAKFSKTYDAYSEIELDHNPTSAEVSELMNNLSNRIIRSIAVDEEINKNIAENVEKA